MLDDVERKIIKAIGISLALFFVSLAWVIVAHADESVAVYTNGQTAIRGECQKEMYYLIWTETYQESYYTRSNYYCVVWSDPLAKLEGNTLTANDLKYFEWTYSSQTLKRSEIENFTLGNMYGKTDLFSNSDLFNYPASSSINNPNVKVHETWFQIWFVCISIVGGLYFVNSVTTGKS